MAAVMGWLLVAGTSVAQSDYERGLRALEPTPEATEELRRADLLFRRASFTECLEDLRAAKSAFDRLSESVDIPDFALARSRLALHFHSLTEASHALAAADDSAPEPLRAQLAFDLALQGGKYLEARALAATWERDSASAEELCRAAKLATFDGQDERADRLLSRAENQLTVKEMRFFAWIALERGALQFRAGHLPQAAVHYRRAESAWSGWWRVDQCKAELMAAEGRFAESEGLYRQLLASQDRPELEQELGDMLLFQKKEAKALECYRRALEVYLDSAARGEVLYLHHLAALFTEGLPNPAESVRWALADVALRPSASARDALAWAYYSSGKYASAAAETRAVLATGSQEAHVLYHSAMILMAAGQIEEARKLLQKPAVAALIGSRTFHAHR